MSDHSLYDALRHFADSWGLLAMLVMFVGFIGWLFRPGMQEKQHRAAMSIFDEDEVDG
ncbi:MAG: cbb3-type cytochrome c oxidase subunit 3 [Sphingomonadaceae bacterium]|nr:cbb3-type cytochrome c oxidase subunit 3 [Sphingomonadaceae bacterium]